jgi:predicted N-acetyltransferase YhbS
MEEDRGPGTNLGIRPRIRAATRADTAAVAAVLQEAAAWLASRGAPMWKANELAPGRLAADVAAGLFFVAESDGTIAGTIKFQLTDAEFWPDVPDGESAFIHRLAVCRRFAGGGVAGALLAWAVARTRALDRRYLRLDCEASRTRLRARYERFGFRHHSDRRVGPYLVARYEIAVADALAADA